MATLCRLDVFLLFTFLNIISNSRYYAYCLLPIMPTPKNTNGGDTPRAGAKRVQPPFTPMRDASPPFMLEF